VSSVGGWEHETKVWAEWAPSQAEGRGNTPPGNGLLFGEETGHYRQCTQNLESGERVMGRIVSVWGAEASKAWG
jgi:hypothetical protein